MIETLGCRFLVYTFWQAGFCPIHLQDPIQGSFFFEQEQLNLEQPEKGNIMILWDPNLSIKNKPFLQLHVANIDVSLGIAGFVLRIGTRATSTRFQPFFSGSAREGVGWRLLVQMYVW